MFLTQTLSQRIVTASLKYLGTSFDWDMFNCVHFVRSVYADVGIVLPILKRYDVPPRVFHLSLDDFIAMPIGHSVFFKRKAKDTGRYWSHVAIVISPDALIHNTRHLGNGVTITSKVEFMEVYDLSQCVK